MGRRLLINFVAVLSVLWAAPWTQVLPDLPIAGSPVQVLVCEHGEKHVPLDSAASEQSVLAQARMGKLRSVFHAAPPLSPSGARSLDVSTVAFVRTGSETARQLVQTWQFHWRTAPEPRAPSLAS